MKPKKFKNCKCVMTNPVTGEVTEFTSDVTISCAPNATLGMMTKEEVLNQEGSETIAVISASPLGESEHPADTFDRMTALGYKLNLITGEYEKNTSRMP